MMNALQREHVDSVMRVVGADDPSSLLPADLSHDQLIRASWQRCVSQHRLDPTRLQQAVILPQARVRERQERIDSFLRIARRGLETLYRQVAGQGYVVLLTDAGGVTVDFIGDLSLDPQLRRAGLYLGSDWNEAHAGTCGVGTVISTGEALTVHQADHFDASHIPLTCTAAPVFDASGSLTAVLDISALCSPLPKSSQHLALQLVKMYAARIENATFLSAFRGQWILRLASAPEFVDVDPECLIALDEGGRIVGHNRAAQLLLQAEDGSRPVLGRAFAEVFDATFDSLGRFVGSHAIERRSLRLAASQRAVFVQATPPTRSPRAAPAQEREDALPDGLAALAGADPEVLAIARRALRLADSPVSVLVTGETGTGKERFAKALHAAGARRDAPFVAVNCAAIPSTLIESELFGHVPNSFSGAGPKGKRGLIEEADGGTLFLDEIGDMPRDLQARLLRVLAEREVLPVGATRPRPVDIRVVAATNRDLETLVRAGQFRDDLYYRLNGAMFRLPALRDRRDLDVLVRRMLADTAGGTAPRRQAAPQISAEALKLLQAYHWPGNLRELRNALDYACAVCSGGYIQPGDLPDWLAAAAREALDDDGHSSMSAQGQLLQQYLRAANWNVSAVARQLGVARLTLYRRMKRYGIRPPGPGR